MVASFFLPRFGPSFGSIGIVAGGKIVVFGGISESQLQRRFKDGNRIGLTSYWYELPLHKARG